MKFCCLFISFLLIVEVSSQINKEILPKSFEIDLNDSVPEVIITAPDMQKIVEEDAVNDEKIDKKFRFGVQLPINVSPETQGNWQTLENGDRIWRLKIKSENAQSINLVLNNYYLPEGAYFHIYNEDHSDIDGAYTSENNSKSKELGTWVVKGDEITAEYFEPAEASGQGTFTISSIYYGYRTYEFPFRALNQSAPCELDVDCGVGLDWEVHKNLNERAVGLVLTTGTNAGWCSGSLINNTSNDGTPYFLTADHCMQGTNPGTVSTRLGWISPNPVCAQNYPSTNGPTTMQLNGASLRANNEASDFALLEFNNNVPASWNRAFAGWDRSDNIPTFSVGIHHPAGDVMKISRDNNPMTKENSFGVYVWTLTDTGGGWEMGVTEPGSSGSPLFDNNGRIIGQLLGGGSACSGLTDNNWGDDYGRFAKSWNLGTTSSTRLSDWLDPTNTGAVAIDAYPSPVLYGNDAAIYSSIQYPHCELTFAIPVTLLNKGISNLTSATIEYQIDSGALQTYSWTGNLNLNTQELVYLPAQTFTTGNHVLSLNVVNPNGQTDDNPQNNTSTNNFSILSEINTTSIHLSLTTDEWPQETTWEFLDGSGTILYSGGPYAGENTTYSATFNVSSSNCYQFIIYDEYGDGICCTAGNGHYELTDSNNNLLASGSDFGSSDVNAYKIGNLGVEDVENADISITISPNPSKTGIFKVICNDSVTNLNYNIFNANGQLLQSKKLANCNSEVDLSKYQDGVYILQFETGQSFKLIKN